MKTKLVLSLSSMSLGAALLVLAFGGKVGGAASNREPGVDDADLPDEEAMPIVDKADYLRRRADYFNMLRGIDPGARFDPRARGRAIEHMEAHHRDHMTKLRAAAAKGGPNSAAATQLATSSLIWTELGPAPIPNGNTEGGATPVSGRTIAVAVHPTNPIIAFVGTAQGGLYRTLDGGTTWTPMMDSAQSLAIGAVAFAPSDPSIVYVGTGEANLSGDSFFGVGLYRINDALGANPVLTGPINPPVTTGIAGTTAFTGVAISKIIVHPTDSGTVFVSTASGVGGNPSDVLSTTVPPLSLLGLYRSTNATAALASVAFEKLTVTTAFSVSPDTTGNRSILDAVIEPGVPDHLICTVRGSSTPGGVYVSTNAFAAAPTFTRTLALTVSRAQLAIQKTGAAVTVYAASGESAGAQADPTCPSGGTLRKSTDGGNTWTSPLPAADGFCSSQCFYDIALAVDPTNPLAVLLGGQNKSTCGKVIARSGDGGGSFVHTSQGVHVDNHVVVFAPSDPSVVYMGTDGGIYKSTNGGASWTSLNNTFFSATQFQSIGTHPNDRQILIGGTQDNGTIKRNADGTWTRVTTGDGGYAIFDRNGSADIANVDDDIAYHTFATGGSAMGWERSVTSGSSWATFNCPNNGIPCNESVLFYAPIALGPGNPNTFYFGTTALYRSLNGQAAAALVSQKPVAADVLTTIAISPQDDNVRLVGSLNGKTFATSTGSTTLTNITGAAFPAPNSGTTNRAVSRAIFHPNDPQTAYITFGGYNVPNGQHVWKTTNLNTSAGAPAVTWVASGDGIPDVPVNCITIDPFAPTEMYVGTDIGVYRSTDSGATWAPFNTGLPRIPIFDIAFQEQKGYVPTDKVLRVATHGRGIWELTLPNPPHPLTQAGTLQLTNESCGPHNNAADPGETITVNLSVKNIGTASTSSLVGTLQSSANVVNPSGPQNYGTIAAGGTATRPFTFTVNGTCGDTVTVTLQVQDGSTLVQTLDFFVKLGTTQPGGTITMSNTTAIAIRDNNTAAPYPSNIVVSGPNVQVKKVTVQFHNLSHTYPDDINTLLVGPHGETVELMSAAGGDPDLSGVELTFDDAAGSSLPNESQIASGTYTPTTYNPDFLFPAPAAAPPHGQRLSVFNGTNPNGTWSLYALDGSPGDSGTMAGGWTLSITTETPVCTSPCNPNTAPTITPQGTARVQGSAAVNTTIATVSDAESSAGSLTVTATTVPTGLTISNITNTNGTVKADIAASCSISTGNKTIGLQVSDGFLTTPANLGITVLSNSFPQLSYNNPSSVALAGSTTVNPATATDNGSLSFALQSQGTYTGTISVNSSTGLVSISNAAPAGSHTITIRATDNCGLTKDATFMLGVYDATAIDALDLNIQNGGYVKATALQPDGKMIIGGGFDHVLGVARNNIARINANGTLDMGFDPNALTGEVDCVVVQPDGKILVGGFFTDLRPNNVFTQRQRIARLNSDGTVDSGFDPEASDTVNCIALQPDGKVVIGGNFTTLSPNQGASVSRNRIARLNTNGTVDTFDPNANSGVASVALQPDGKVVLAGGFTTLKPNGAAVATTRNRIARVNSDGTLDTGFDPKANSFAECVALQPDGKVLIGGTFTTLQPNGAASTTTRNHVARVNSDGTLDTGFNPNAGSSTSLNVYSLALQTDGKVLIAGDFTTLQPNGAASSTVRNRIARVNSDGSLDTGFDPNASPFSVMTVALQSDAKVLLGGQFTGLKPNGAAVATPRNWFARLFNDPVTQSVTAPDTSQVLWTRSGAGPELYQVTFELSTDGGTNWSPLGNGTRVGASSNWKLTGLSLPTTGQLRARGSTTNGLFNGGSGIIEQVAAYTASAPNNAPSITPAAGLSRQQGTAASNSTIATVNDVESAPGSLIVTAPTVPVGLAVSNIVNTNGTITADIATSCSATLGNNTVVLQVSDGSLTTNANLVINVTANTAPALSYGDPVAFAYGGSTTNNPATASDNGTITSFGLQSLGTYTGTISVNSSTGAVSISDAAPVGGHTITIRATDNCGLFTDSSFTLVVSRKAVKVTADPEVKVKDTPDPAFTYVATGLVGSETLSGALARSAGETPGSYPITQGTVTDANNPNYAITFVSANLVITGPVASSDAVSRLSGSGNSMFPLANLLANDHRVDSNGASQTNNLSITGVTAGSGNSVSISGAFVSYTPDNAAATAPLTFTYTVTDSVSGATDVGTVTVTTVDLQIVQAGTATYNAGTDTTSITVSFATLPNTSLNLEYSTDLNGWVAYTGNPVSSPTGSLVVTFTASGNQTAIWNGKMFFHATASP